MNSLCCPQRLEKTTLKKLLRKTQIHFFPLNALTAQTAQAEEFMLQNVAYRPTVYRTGVWIRVKRKFLAHSALPPTHTRPLTLTTHGEQSQNWTEKKQGRTEETSCRSETTQSAFGQLGVRFYHLGCQENVIHCT